MTDSKQCAFPTTENSHVGSGLTKREYFAVKMAAAIIASNSDDIKNFSLICSEAVKVADALTQALNEIPNPQK